ncbi:hypothetical protein ACH4JS_13150 [Streptomyces sp. NPDC017638]|uniref:hypothetical protein n=1 Tax=Streptomyces sp. NPDC017638 TaxID=3365004 RepID=UPI0037978DD4
MTGWFGHYERGVGERWVIDPTYAEGHGATGHRRLTALLAAPGWGLPVTSVDEHCNCHLPPGFSDQCTTPPPPRLAAETATHGCETVRKVVELRVSSGRFN